MSRSLSQAAYTNFSNGLITEANELSFPDNSCKEIVNFDILDNGSVRRRPGLDDNGSNFLTSPLTAANFLSATTRLYYWQSAGGDADYNIVVILVGGTFYFYYVKDDGTPILDTIAADPYTPSAPTMAVDEPIDCISGNGYFWVSSKVRGVSYLEFDAPASSYGKGSITETRYSVEIRDLEVWKGSTDANTGYGNTTSITPQHEYNLRNGGWPASNVACCTAADPTTGVEQKIPTWQCYTKVGFYPSITVPYYSTKAGLGTTVEQQTAFSAWAVNSITSAQGAGAILGHYIVNAHGVSRSGTGSVSDYPGGDGATTPPTTVSGGNGYVTPVYTQTYSYGWVNWPTSIAFYAGRIWYSGVNEPNFSSNLYFSQVLGSTPDNAGKCYQENDPTDQDINQLLATDGGILKILDMSNVIKMVSFKGSLILFAENGIWQVSGKDFNSFDPTSYNVSKISNRALIGKDGIVENDTSDAIIFLTADSIYELTIDQISGSVIINDLAYAKVRSKYNSIQIANKQKAFVCFDSLRKLFYMFYQSSPYVGSVEYKNYNRVLIYNAILKSFYEYDLGASAIQSPIAGIYLPTAENSNNNFNIYLLTQATAGSVYLKFSQFTNYTDFKDWSTYYSSYLETGFNVLKDMLDKAKKTPLITFNFIRTETGYKVDPSDPSGNSLIFTNPSSCIFYNKWNYAESWGSGEQVYKYLRPYVPSGVSDPLNYDRSLITTRVRLRGRGTALDMRLESENGYDMQLLGAALYVSTRTGRI